jgi:hypothetical protein
MHIATENNGVPSFYTQALTTQASKMNDESLIYLSQVLL